MVLISALQDSHGSLKFFSSVTILSISNISFIVYCILQPTFFVLYSLFP